MIVIKAKRVTLINFFMIRSPFIQFYQDSSTREKQRVYVILAKVEIVYYNGNQVSGKYLFFGKNFLTLHFKDGPLFLSIIYCKYKDKYSVEVAPWKEIWIYVD